MTSDNQNLMIKSSKLDPAEFSTEWKTKLITVQIIVICKLVPFFISIAFNLLTLRLEGGSFDFFFGGRAWEIRQAYQCE